MSSNQSTRVIGSVNSWRGLMAVAVVLFHCGVGWIYNVAVSGVTFFFLSSAFLLTERYSFERLTLSGYCRFVLSHAMRLYPLHWLGLAMLIAVTLAFHTMPIDWSATALSALLLHSWSPVHDVHYGLNPVAWYMCALLFCYAVFPLLAHLLVSWRLRYKALLSLTLAIVLGVVLLPLDIPRREAVFVNPVSHVLDVVAGITLCHFYQVMKARYPRLSMAAATRVEISALLLLAVVIAVNVATTWIRPWEDDIIWLVPQGAILVALAMTAGREGVMGRLLLVKPLQWMGGISFEMFVLQFVAFHLFNYALSPVAGHFGWDIYAKLPWLVLPLLVLLSWAVNRCFTRPVGAYLKCRFNNKIDD